MNGRQQLLAAWIVSLGLASYSSATSDTPPWNVPLPSPEQVLHASVFFGLLGVVEPIVGEPITGLLAWGTLAALIITQAGKHAGGTIAGSQAGTAAAVGGSAAGSAAGTAAQAALPGHYGR